ncbi:MAG TPA: hypothetical protein DD733_09385 [Clostridiales bacterium]|nr:hypothetical protein [Eubacteriales bacterium]HBR32280.1 hypothetical protein [Clostridiales bacterium]
MTDFFENETVENVKRNINELAYPALILDREYKIIYKNDFCIKRLIPLRMLSSIKNHLSSADFRRLIQLSDGEIISVSIELAVLCYAYIYRYNDIFVVSIKTLYAIIQNRISELLDMGSAFTEAMLCQINTVTGHDKKSIAETIKKKGNRIIRSQQHISEFLRIVNGVKNTKTELCDTTIVMNTLMRSLSDTLRPLGLNISFNVGSEINEARNAYISEPDFNTIICLSLYNCIRISQSGRIQVNSNIICGKLYITMITDSILPEEKAKYLCSCELESEKFYPPDGWIYFELLLIKMLCEYYFWEIKITSPGLNYSRLQIAISLPLEPDKKPDCVTRTSEAEEAENKRLISLEFSDFLDKPEGADFYDKNCAPV